VFKNLQTVIYYAPDLEKAKAWYSQVLGIQPDVVETSYVGFCIGGYELVLQPNQVEGLKGLGSAIPCWGVEHISEALEHLTKQGATVISATREVSNNAKLAVLQDPFGNALGIIENPHFAKQEVFKTPIRYMVKDTDAAVEFYTNLLGFELLERWGPAFAIISKSNLTLWLSGPNTSAAQAMPDGRVPEAGGWNRIVLEVTGLEALIETLKQASVTFRNDLLDGVGGKQVLIEDPSGNPIELFEAK
jgi:catechol 2,3-dioxygenase-like lactoylglutathione lyase family enzyme